MSNPTLNTFRLEETQSTSGSQKTNTNSLNMLSENEPSPLEINTAPNSVNSPFKSQSTTSPTSEQSSPSTVSKLKSFFKKRRNSTPNHSIFTNTEESNNRTISEQTPTSPTFKYHNDKLSLHVTFKDDHNKQHRIHSSPVPLSTLNASLALDNSFESKTNDENLQVNEKFSPDKNKAKSKKARHNYSKHSKKKHKNHQKQLLNPTEVVDNNCNNLQTIINTTSNSSTSDSALNCRTADTPLYEDMLRNPTHVIASSSNNPTSLASNLKKTEPPASGTIASNYKNTSSPPLGDQCINFGAANTNNQLNCSTTTTNLRGGTQQTIAMAMDKVEPVSSGFGVGLVDTENFVNTKQVGSQRMISTTTSPVVIKKVGTKQQLDNMIEDFLLTKNSSSPTHDEITPNRNAIIEEEESSDEDYSEEDNSDHSDEESNEEEERSSESEDLEETKPNLDTSTLTQTNNENENQAGTDVDDVKTMISPQDLQTISYEVNEKLNESVQKEFNLSKEEQVLDSFLCAYYESKMPQQGKMYITQNYVCFSSNIFGYKICLVISFSDIKSIEKKMTAMIIPNAIEIFLKDDSSHFFGSFVFRDNVYKVLLALYSLHAKARGNILISLRSANNVLQGVNTPNIKPPNLATDSSYVTEEDDNEEDNEEEEEEETEDETEEEEETEESSSDSEEPIVINKITTIPVETMAKGATDTNQSKPNGESSKGKSTNNNTNNNGGGAEEKENGNQSNGNGNEEKKANDNSENNNGNNGNNPNNNQNNNQNGNPEEQEEEDDEEEIQLPEEEDKITGVNDLPGGEFFADPDKFKPKEISSEVLPVSIFDAWCILKSDNTSFQLEHHKAREETSVQYSSYVKLAGSPGLMRKVAFIAKVNNSLGPKSTRIECVERAVLCKGKKRIINQTSSSSLDVPFSDTFKIQNYWIFEDIDGKSCTLKIYSGVHFLKSSLLRWKIEDAGDKESKLALTVWLAQAKDAISNAKSAGNLQSLKKGKPRKKKAATKETKKRSKRKASEVKTQATAAAFASENPFAPSTSAPAEIELDLLTKTLNFVMGIPGYLSANITLPAWLLLTVIVALLFLLFSQQYTIIQTIKQVEYNVQTYKQQTILFEQELNHLVFNLANVNTTALSENSQNLQNQISNWLSARNELYKTHIDNDLLHSLLYELSEIKKIMYKKDNG